MYIYDDAFVIAYLQANEITIGLTPKEKDCVVHRVKHFKSEGNSFIRMWANGQVKVAPRLEKCESLMKHVHEELAILGSDKHTICSRHNVGGEGCNCKFNNLFLGVWCVTKSKHLSMHLHFTYNLYQLWGLGIDGVWILSIH